MHEGDEDEATAGAQPIDAVEAESDGLETATTDGVAEAADVETMQSEVALEAPTSDHALEARAAEFKVNETPSDDTVAAPAGEDVTSAASDNDSVAAAPDQAIADHAADETTGPAAALATEVDPIADDVEPMADGVPAETDERLIGILESVLFACGEPITLARLSEVIAGPSKAELRAALTALGERAEREHRGLRLIEVAGGYQFRTAPEHAEWVRRLFQQRPWRLTRATLETLAIIAYKQPITRAEIESIRGVDVDSVLASLLARKLVKIVGRKEVIGRPLLYGTTRQFLEVFGLRDLAALPGLAEVASAMPDTVEAGAASSGEETWSSDDRPDEGRTPTEAAGGLGDLLPASSGDDDRERPGDGERHDGQDPGDAGPSD
ncbi:MAG: SMC-Scp complex subunit ScpB [Candidatus Binatia bacterium]